MKFLSLIVKSNKAFLTVPFFIQQKVYCETAITENLFAQNISFLSSSSKI